MIIIDLINEKNITSEIKYYKIYDSLCLINFINIYCGLTRFNSRNDKVYYSNPILGVTTVFSNEKVSHE